MVHVTQTMTGRKKCTLPQPCVVQSKAPPCRVGYVQEYATKHVSSNQKPSRLRSSSRRICDNSAHWTPPRDRILPPRCISKSSYRGFMSCKYNTELLLVAPPWVRASRRGVVRRLIRGAGYWLGQKTENKVGDVAISLAPMIRNLGWGSDGIGNGVLRRWFWPIRVGVRMLIYIDPR